MKKNLIVARCGDSSLHLNWLQGESPNFDLIVTYYGNKIPDHWTLDNPNYKIVHIKGSKWGGLTEYFENHEEWKNYDYVLLPDDDLLFDAKLINNFFKKCNLLNIDLAQPALDHKSYFTHPITLQHLNFDYRFTNFTEIMIPCLSKRMLLESLPLFKESDSGWGMDNYWWPLIVKNGFNPPVIVDSTPITHTRPVGSAGHGVGAAGGNHRTPVDDLNDFIKKYNFSIPRHITLGGTLKSGRVLDFKAAKQEFKFYLIHDMLGLSKIVHQTRLAQCIWELESLFETEIHKQLKEIQSHKK